MKFSRVGLVPAVVAVLSSPVFAQEPDPAWHGTWSLNVGKSKGHGEGWAKQSRLLFTPQGWVETAVARNGELAGVAVALGSGGGCVMIAAGLAQSCEYRFVDPMHIVMALKGLGPMPQTVNIRLLNRATVEVVVKGTGLYGRSISGTQLWEKVSPSRSGGIRKRAPRG